MNQCSICLEEIPEDNRITIVNCGHSFCKECIYELFNRNMLDCPLCRGKIHKYIYNDQIVHIVVRNLETSQLETNDLETNRLDFEFNELEINYYKSRKFIIMQWLLIVILFIYLIYLSESKKNLLVENEFNILKLRQCYGE